MLQAQRQAVTSRPPVTVFIAPPGPRIDNIPAFILVERDADDLARVALPLSYYDRVGCGRAVIWHGGTPMAKTCEMGREEIVSPRRLSGLILWRRRSPPLGTTFPPGISEFFED